AGLPEPGDRIQAGVVGAAAGVRLDRERRDLPPLAQIAHHLLDLSRVDPGEGAREAAVWRLQYVLDTGQPAGSQQRGGQSGLAAAAGMYPFDHRTVLGRHEEATERAGDAEGVGGGGRRQAQQPGGRGRSTERAGVGAGVKPAGELPGTGDYPDPGTYLEPADDGGE